MSQAPPGPHGIAHVPLAVTRTVPAGHAQVPLWQVAQPLQSLFSQQLAHCPLLQSSVPGGQAAQVPPEQLLLQH